MVVNISESIPFEIPKSWNWSRLGYVGDWGAGATPNRGISEYYNGTIPWLKTGELNNGIIYDSVEKITEKALKKCSLRYNKKGDVLIAMYGATICKLAIAEINLTTNQACCACTPNKSLNNQYLFYYLMSQKDNFIKWVKAVLNPTFLAKSLLITLSLSLLTMNKLKYISKFKKHYL